MLRQIAAYILIALGILTYLFFRNYTGHLIPYRLLFYLMGICMVYGGIHLLFFTSSLQAKKNQKLLQMSIDELKKNGQMINVDFSQCEIKGNDFTEERELYNNSRIQAWNVIAGDEQKNVEQVEVYQSMIIFHTSFNGKNETFSSGIIPKDKVTLMFLLDEKKSTTIYVDKMNRSNYYFDLEFLNNPIKMD